MLRLAALAALLLLALPATASLVESTSDAVLGPLAPVTTSVAEAITGATGVEVGLDHLHYQVDAGTEYDAPDDCAGALASDLPFDLPIGGDLQGLLVPVDDEVDMYRVPIGQDLVGSRVTVSVLGQDATLPVGMDVHMPACGTSVAAPENQPAPPKADPAPAAGEKQVTPHNLDNQGWSCGGRWFFVLNQFGGRAAPASIHATWTDGSQADIPLLKDTPATIAQYATSEHQDFTLDSVTANVPEDWTGQFNVAEGPCDAADGHAVFGDPAVVRATSITFTPIEAGTYVLEVRAVPPQAPTLGTSVPASCHQFCAALPQSMTDTSGYKALAF